MFCLDTQDNSGNGHGWNDSAARGEGRKHGFNGKGHSRGRMSLCVRLCDSTQGNVPFFFRLRFQPITTETALPEN